MMLVRDAPEYNDTVTRAFRELSVSSHSQELIGFSYLDVAKQEEFVKMFGKVPSSLRRCEDGGKARPVSYVFAEGGKLKLCLRGRRGGKMEGGRERERERERETDRDTER